MPAEGSFEHLEEGLRILNSLLEGRTWLAGNTITLADYSVLISVSHSQIIPSVDLSKYPNTVRWFERIKEVAKGYDEIVAENMGTQNIIAPILYYANQSPPCQLVLLIAKHLNLDLDLKHISSIEDTRTPEFLKKNPAHTIPTLDDDGFCLAESRAISIYLLEKYGKGDPLLPKDYKTKALVNQRLFFDLGVLWQRAYAVIRPIKHNIEMPAPEIFKQLEEGLEILNSFLEGLKWVAGDTITIADYAILVTASFAEAIPVTDLNKYRNITRWMEKAKKEVKGYDEIVAPVMKTRKELFLEKYTNLK